MLSRNAFLAERAKRTENRTYSNIVKVILLKKNSETGVLYGL